MPVKQGLYRVYAQVIPKILGKALGLIGYNVSRQKDYNSPLPTVSYLKKNIDRWYRPSGLTGIKFDIGEMEELLTSLLSQYREEFLQIPSYEELFGLGLGIGYDPVDAFTLFAMIRHVKPARYIEVGSGLSTYYCSLAAKKNAEEGFPLKITCIEPFPSKKLYSIPAIEVLAKEVQDIEPGFFDQLQENDVLFIDSSHTLRVDSDVAYLYLEVLPALKKGVFTHIHDIPFPYNIPYPPDVWIFGKAEPIFWNEAMVLQTFLSGNDSVKMLLSMAMIRFYDEGYLEKNIPNYTNLTQNAGSVWLQRIS